MRCPRCGAEIHKGWHYCPVCGFRLKGPASDVDDIFSIVEKEIKEVDKLFEKNLEFFDLTPWFRKGKRGFTIRITQNSGRKPDIVVKTYGDVDKEKVEKEVYNRFGIHNPLKDRGVFETGKKPKITEEPKTEVRRIGDRISVDIYLPDVKSEKDIEIKSLYNSIEVKATTGDKMYFKILTKPPEARITGHSFSNGILHIDFNL